MILVSVFDKKAGSYGACYCVDNIAVACRSFQNTVKNGDNDLNRFPEDFELCQVGEFNESTGVIKPIKTNVLMTALSCFPKDVQKKVVRKYDKVK